jgi:recombination protein RecT
MAQAEVARRNPQQELIARVRSPEFREQVALALPGGVTPERFARIAVTALLDSPEVAQAEPDSVFRALLRCAQDGLLPDGREAALVVFGSRKDGARRAVYMPMVGGLRKLAGEHGWTIQARVVYERDEFRVELGDTPRIRHVPVRPGEDRGRPIGAYAVARHADGRVEVEVMGIEDIERVRRVSRAANEGPWVDWWDRMAEKTVVRRLFRKLPLAGYDARVERVLRADPDEARSLLYGTTGSPDVGSRPAEGGGDESIGGSAALPEVGGAEGLGKQPARPTADPEPELEPEPEPGPEPAATVDALAGLIERAGAAVVPNGVYAGKTIAEVANSADGERWLRWCLRQASHPCHEAVVIYTRHVLPHVYAGAGKED